MVYHKNDIYWARVIDWYRNIGNLENKSWFHWRGIAMVTAKEWLGFYMYNTPLDSQALFLFFQRKINPYECMCDMCPRKHQPIIFYYYVRKEDETRKKTHTQNGFSCCTTAHTPFFLLHRRYCGNRATYPVLQMLEWCLLVSFLVCV